MHQPSESESTKESGLGFWDDHLLQYSPNFTLGHPYLQGQWRRFEQEKLKHIVKLIVVILFWVAIGLAGSRIMFYFLYYIIPMLCVVSSFFSIRRWQKRNAQLVAREKQLSGASRSLQEHCTAIVQYTVEEIGRGKMDVVQRGAPNARILIEGAKSVPKYCGSWRICNWQSLSESDRAYLHSDNSYITGKVWHSIDQSFALLTDSGIILWFV